MVVVTLLGPARNYRWFRPLKRDICDSTAVNNHNNHYEFPAPSHPDRTRLPARFPKICGFLSLLVEGPGMSKATKIVLVTLVLSAVIGLAMVVNLGLAS